MPTCEMCGKETNVWPHKIEGAELSVCKYCSRHGEKLKKIPRRVNVKAHNYRTNVTDETIVSDYDTIIRTAREKLKLKQEDFAKKINERLSVVQNIETKKFKPSIKLAKKLEKILNISLVTEDKKIDISQFTSKSKSNTLTLGDMIKIKK
jgi:putative transcription factor